MLKLDPSSHCDVCLDEFTSDEFDVHAPHSAPCGRLTLSLFMSYETLNSIACVLGHVACLDCFRRTALFAHEDGLKCPLCAAELTEGDIRKLQVQIGPLVAGSDLNKRRSQASVSGSKRPPSTLAIEAMMLETRVAKLLATAMTRQMTKAEVDNFIKVERDADAWLETACRGNHGLRVSY
jgi:ribosomal protein S27E